MIKLLKILNFCVMYRNQMATVTKNFTFLCNVQKPEGCDLFSSNWMCQRLCIELHDRSNFQYIEHNMNVGQ
jgi:hypothetical protein